MEIICIDNGYKAKSKSVIALGNFDGVHIGHKELLKNLVNMAKEKNIKSSILVFKNHTKNLLAKKAQNLITSNRKKYEIFENMVEKYIFNIDNIFISSNCKKKFFIQIELKEESYLEINFDRVKEKYENIEFEINTETFGKLLSYSICEKGANSND